MSVFVYEDLNDVMNRVEFCIDLEGSYLDTFPNDTSLILEVFTYTPFPEQPSVILCFYFLFTL